MNTLPQIHTHQVLLHATSISPAALGASAFQTFAIRPPSPLQGDLGHSATPIAGLDVSWTVLDDALRLQLTVGSEVTWVGLGYGDSMSGSDISFCEITHTPALSVRITDRWASGHSLPVLDTALGGTDDIADPSISEVDGKVRLSFTRKLVTGDSNDKNILLPETNNFIFAFSTSPGISYHGYGFRAAASLDLVGGGAAILGGGWNHRHS